MREQCEGFNERETVIEEYRCRDLIRQLDSLLQRFVFTLVAGRDVWPEIVASSGPRWDTYKFQFECSICSSVFELNADFYHGRSSWGLLHDGQEQNLHTM